MKPEEKAFFMVWNSAGWPPRYRHDTEVSARLEADRLAVANGGRYYVLQAIAFVEKNETRVVELKQDMPF